MTKDVTASGQLIYAVKVFTIVMVTPTMIANIAWKTYLVFMACVYTPSLSPNHHRVY